MFERIVRNIVPPEMAALLLPASTSPEIKGYLYRRGDIELYHSKAGYLTVLRTEAHVYSWRDVQFHSRHSWSWGNKAHGSWVVVYA